MKTLTLGIVDYVIFVLLLLASFGVGIYFGFKNKSNTTVEYLMGNRQMKVLPIALSLVASQLSGASVMMLPAEAYAFGSNQIFMWLSIIVAIPILNFIIIPVFYENRFNNCYEYLEKRFSKFTRQLVTLTVVLSWMLVLPSIMFIPSLAFSQVTGFSVHWINIILTSICGLYTMLGGIKAVVWTDVLQAGVMFSTVGLVVVMGVIKTGGLGKVLENASDGGRIGVDLSWDPRARITLWNAIVHGIVLWTNYIGFNQSCVQRIVSLPSLRHARRSMYIACVGILILLSFNVFTGIVMYAYYHHCDPILAGHVSKADKMMPFFAKDVLGHLMGMPGIFVSCVFSAALSTLSAVLNSLSGIVYFDYIKPFIKHTEARANCIMKMFVVFTGVYCVLGGLLVHQFTSLLQMTSTLSSISAGAVVSIFLLGLFVPRVNTKVAVLSFVLSILAMIWLIVNARLRIQQGLLKYKPLPTQIDGCDALGIEVLKKNFTTTIHPTISKAIVTTDFSIYDISFVWYKTLGALFVMLIALPLSYIFKADQNEQRDSKLYSPYVRKWLVSRVVELDEVLPLNVISNNADRNETTELNARNK